MTPTDLAAALRAEAADFHPAAPVAVWMRAAADALDQQAASGRAFCSWLDGIIVDEDWDAIRPGLARFRQGFQ